MNMNGPQLCEIQVEMLWEQDTCNNKITYATSLWDTNSFLQFWFVFNLWHVTHTDSERIWAAALQSRVISHKITIRYPKVREQGEGSDWLPEAMYFFIWLKNIWSRLCNHYANAHGKQSVISTELSVHAGSVFTNNDTQYNVSYKMRKARSI